ncbi:hypothetical protein MXB_841 [Myxobolus squamalis]|nr:hypothetical protein MXB_841 [Myxobolus squamalis]
MAFDVSSNLTIPCVWCLTSVKNGDMYGEILHHIFILLNCNSILQEVIFTFDRPFVEKCRIPDFLQQSATLACSLLEYCQLLL